MSKAMKTLPRQGHMPPKVTSRSCHPRSPSFGPVPQLLALVVLGDGGHSSLETLHRSGTKTLFLSLIPKEPQPDGGGSLPHLNLIPASGTSKRPTSTLRRLRHMESRVQVS